MCVGFYRTELLTQNLVGAWTWGLPMKNMLVLVFAPILMALLTNLLGKRRAPLIAVSSIWLLIAFGIGAVGTVVYVCISAYAIGCFFLGRSQENSSEYLKFALLNIGVGCAVIMLVVQLAVLLPINAPPVYLLILAIPIIVKLDDVLSLIRRAFSYARYSRFSSSSETYTTLALMTVFWVHSVLAALPETRWDAVASHLMIPFQVLSQWNWHFDPIQLSISLMPNGAIWLYCVNFFLGGEPAVKLGVAAFHFAAMALLYFELKQRLSNVHAMLFVTVLSSSEMALELSQSIFVENTLMFFGLTAFLVVRKTTYNINLLSFFSAIICLGAVMCVKLHGVALAFPLCIYLLIHLFKTKKFTATLGFSVLAIPLFAVSGLFPYIYAYWVTGNPVFPLFNGFFESPYWGQYNGVDARWIGKFSWKLLYQMTFYSPLFSETIPGSLGFQHLLLLPAGLFLVATLGPSVLRMSLIVLVVYAGVVLLNAQYIRYLWPVFPFMALVESKVLETFFTKRPFSTVGTFLLTGLLVANLILPPSEFWAHMTIYLKLAMSRQETMAYLERKAPIRIVNDAVNATHGARARVFYVSLPCGAGLKGRPYYAWNGYGFMTTKKFSQAGNVEQVTNLLLRDMRITHVIIDELVLKGFPYAELLREVLKANGKHRLTINGVELYELDERTSKSSNTVPENDQVGSSQSIGARIVKDYTIGEQLEFDKDAVNEYLGTGWSFREDWGRWTDGSVAQLFFGLSSFSPGGVYRLEITGHLFRPDSQEVVLLLNGSRIGKISAAAQETERQVFEFQGNLLQEKNTLTFQVSKPVAPKDLGLSEDLRLLGLRVRKVHLMDTRKTTYERSL
jgi:hypothetical protein